MIVLCSGKTGGDAFDALLLIAATLDQRGHEVVIPSFFLPKDASRPIQFEATRYLTDWDDILPAQLLMIGADILDDDVLVWLRDLDIPDTCRAYTLGVIDGAGRDARATLAHAIGRRVRFIEQTPPAFVRGIYGPLFAHITNEALRPPGKAIRVLAYLPHTMLELPDVVHGLQELEAKPGLDLHVLTNGAGKEWLHARLGNQLSVFGYSELPPDDLIHYGDVIAFFGPAIDGARMAALALNAVAAGKVVIDATETGALAEDEAPVLRGPLEPVELAEYIETTVSANISEIGAQARQSGWLAKFDVMTLERELGLVTPKPETAHTDRVIIFPTDDDSTQSCLAIAKSMQRVAEFVAFPRNVAAAHAGGFACTPMVASSSGLYHGHENDLINTLRLRGLVQRGDRFVFDGSFVFDSVYRLISNLQLRAVWIKRHAARPSYLSEASPERAFETIILPGEAFAELDVADTSAPYIRKIGPLVQVDLLDRTEISGLREQLCTTFDRDIETIVVTMLDGGTTSERTARIQVLCAALERRPRCIHLVVTAPGDVVSPTIYAWKNTEVVHTLNAHRLCQAADLVVSSAGYSAAHMLLYSHIPSILIPVADTQDARSLAASERGLAVRVEGSDMVHLDRELSAFLDAERGTAIREALQFADLPTPGTAQAAELIDAGSVS